MNILFQYEAGPQLRAEAERLTGGAFRIMWCDQADDARFESLLPETDMLWHVLRPVTERHMAAALRLKLIQKIGVGVNTVDLDAARARAIAVCNMPGTNTRAVSELTLLLMLAVLRRACVIDARCRCGNWVPDAHTRESFSEIGGKTIGFAGFGVVPKMLAPVLAAMGARMVYVSREPKTMHYERLALTDALAASDIVSVHLPLTRETKGLIGARELAAMKPGAVLINTARGGIVDEAALHDALVSGHLAGAGLDVFETEPAGANDRLFALENVVVTPHIAWPSRISTAWRLPARRRSGIKWRKENQNR